ncbi:hypothetical protein [Actinomadura sp. WMMA1423]|uniref:hypothetical protein n=1 Tax=Actinomadura sp. WMMA1423 TaxID=2591108 RepID=UPI0011464B43|nr:hypothetical protein [Actinomadura sp. WMMA1423]
MVEFFIAYIKGEKYDLTRAGMVLAGLAALMAVLVLMHFLGRELQLFLEIFLLINGIALTLFGIVAVIKDQEVPGAALLGLGIGLSATTTYLIYVQRSGADLLFALSTKLETHSTSESERDGFRSVTVKYSSFAASDEEVLRLCEQIVHPDDIHWIGFFVKRKCRFYVDVLDNSRLNRFFRSGTRGERRLNYERSGRRLEWILGRMNRYMSRLESGILIRTILDVEHGSLSYYYIDKDVYLIGVTMDQSQVLEVDEKLRSLANQIGLLPRGWVFREERHQQVS